MSAMIIVRALEDKQMQILHYFQDDSLSHKGRFSQGCRRVIISEVRRVGWVAGELSFLGFTARKGERPRTGNERTVVSGK